MYFFLFQSTVFSSLEYFDGRRDRACQLGHDIEDIVAVLDGSPGWLEKLLMMPRCYRRRIQSGMSEFCAVCGSSIVGYKTEYIVGGKIKCISSGNIFS